MAYDNAVLFKDTTSVAWKDTTAAIWMPPPVTYVVEVSDGIVFGVALGGVSYPMSLTDGIVFGANPFHRRPTSEHDIWFKGAKVTFNYIAFFKTVDFTARPITGNFKALPITTDFIAIQKQFFTEAL